MAAFTQSPTDLNSPKWRLLHSCTPTQDSKAVQDVKGENRRRSDHCDCWEGDQTLSRGPNENLDSLHHINLSFLPSLASSAAPICYIPLFPWSLHPSSLPLSSSHDLNHLALQGVPPPNFFAPSFVLKRVHAFIFVMLSAISVPSSSPSRPQPPSG